MKSITTLSFLSLFLLNALIGQSNDFIIQSTYNKNLYQDQEYKLKDMKEIFAKYPLSDELFTKNRKKTTIFQVFGVTTIASGLTWSTAALLQEDSGGFIDFETPFIAGAGIFTLVSGAVTLGSGIIASKSKSKLINTFNGLQSEAYGYEVPSFEFGLAQNGIGLTLRFQ